MQKPAAEQSHEKDKRKTEGMKEKKKKKKKNIVSNMPLEPVL